MQSDSGVHNTEMPLHYTTYRRTSTYDPNMCSTAATRLSPTSHLQSQHHQSEQSISDNYGNIIFLPCNQQGNHQQQEHGQHLKTNTSVLPDFTTYSNQTYNGYDERHFVVDENHVHHNHHHAHHLLNDDLSTKNIHEIHSGNPLEDPNSYNHPTMCTENDIEYSIPTATSTSTAITTMDTEIDNSQMTYSPSQQPTYQHHPHQQQQQQHNYYIQNDVNVIDENVVAAAASIVEMHHHYHQQHQQHQYVVDQQTDDDSFRIHTQNSGSGLINGFSAETNFVNLDSSEFEVAQQELIDDNYETVSTENVETNTITSLGLSEKDHQRFMLRRTISPLLAVINDITQRDAELQSYLNQSRSNATDESVADVNVFQMNESNERVDYDQTKEYLDINDVRTEDNDNKLKCKGRRRKSKLKKKISKCRKKPECDTKDETCLLIADKPIESRARASLPTNYLCFVKNKDNIDDVPVVCAKRDIPNRTKFGPFEGEICLVDESAMNTFRIQSSQIYPLLLLDHDKILNTSNENTANWMKFVRMAETFNEQNLVLIQDDNDGRLYFRCCRSINTKEELCVGYSKEYAEKFNLEILQQHSENIASITNDEEKNNDDENVTFYNSNNNPWPCFECDKRFQTSDDLQNHLNEHDPIENEINDVDDEFIKEQKENAKKKRKKKNRKSSLSVRELSKGIQKNSSRCFYCSKVFMTSVSLKKHIASHVAEKRSLTKLNSKQQKLVCNSNDTEIKCCYRRFSSEEKLQKHHLEHLKNEIKPYKCNQCDRCCATETALFSHLRSHSNSKRFRCAYCSESFKIISELKNHVSKHSMNGIYPCHLCGKKYRNYNLARKHIRLFHPGVTYSCTICNRQFAYMNTLRRHMSCHSDRKEFLCSQCGRQFKRRDKLKEHMETVHSEARKQQKLKKKQQQQQQQQEQKLQNQKSMNKRENSVNDYEEYMYKCHECMCGFKRRGMLINHMVKRHPHIQIDSIPELNLPILKAQSLFFCPYCTKVYKSNSKRKVHILKSHPGQELPPSARNNPHELLNARTIGSIKADPQRCQWCYKQYTTRHRLLMHYRKEHSEIKINTSTKSTDKSLLVETHENEDNYCDHQNSEYHNEQEIVHQQFENNDEQFVETFYHHEPQNSPENKLLKLSSAALELEERRFLDFLNEQTDEDPQEIVVVAPTETTMKNHNSYQQQSNHHNIISTIDDDNATDIDDVENAFSKVDVSNFKVENEFSQTSNKLPQLLFEESIVNLK